MISASQLARAAAQLDGLAGRLSGAAEHLARVHQQASEHAASLRTAWDGPLPAAVTAGASNYITQVDGHPAADAVPAVQQWAASAREHADALLTIEMRRSRTAYELAHTTPASIGIGPEAEQLAADRRRALSSELSAIDGEVEQLHEDWTRTCATYAGTIDSFSAALRAQAAVSAVSEFAAASPGSFAWLDPTAMAAFLASLSASELAALFGDAEVVQDWWDSLSDEERIAFVAARPGGFTGALDEVVDTWKDGLDADGLRALYTTVAMVKAGIDPATWDPTQGFAANQANVYAVYDYYSSLYLSDPEKFWWAGMASMIGPSFVAGMTDLSDAGTMSEIIARLAAMGSTMPGIPGSISGLTSLSAGELEEELEFYEVTLLQMQKEIFLDMAVAHEAYLDGGMDTIERLYADDPYGHGSDAITAWRRIDEGAASGDTDMVAGGNRDLLLREQLHVINDDYRMMRDRPVTGEAFTYVFTAVGAPSIPGASGYAEVFPINAEVRASTDGGLGGWLRDALLPVEVEAAVGTATPLPDGNVANFEDRWALIEEDTLPAYVELLEENPDEAASILSTPVADRVDEWRIGHRIDDIVTNWDPYVDVDVEADGSVFSVVGDGVSSAWDWAFGGNDAPDPGPVEVPTHTTTTTTTVPSPTDDVAPPPSTDPAEQGPPSATVPTTTVPGG